jgi:hypothetical protein
MHLPPVGGLHAMLFFVVSAPQTATPAPFTVHFSQVPQVFVAHGSTGA